MAQKISYKQLGDDIIASLYPLAYLRQDTVNNQYNQSITVGREKVTLYSGDPISDRLVSDLKIIQVLDEYNRVTGIGTIQSYDDTADEFEMYLLSYGQSDVVIDDTADSISTVYSSTKVETLVKDNSINFYETSHILTKQLIGNSSVVLISDIDNEVKKGDIIYDTDCILGLVTEVDSNSGTTTVETIFSADVKSSLVGVIFETLHNYTVGDIIVRNNKLYQCSVSYVSTTDFDTDLSNGYWTIMNIMLNGGEIV